MKLVCHLFTLAALLGAATPARSADVDPERPSPQAEGPTIRDENPPPPGEPPREGEGPRRPPRGEFGEPGRPPEGGFRPDGSSRNEGSPRSEGGPRPEAGPRNDDGGPRPQPGFRNDGGGGPRGEFRGPPTGGPPTGLPGMPMGHGGQAGPGMMHGGPRGFGGPFGHDIERIKDEDPEMYALMKGDQDLERETFDLSNRFRQTMKSDDREKIKAELQAAVEKHFEIRQQRRELELKRLEEQLKRMKDSVAKRLAEKEPIIEQRIKELTGEQDSGF